METLTTERIFANNFTLSNEVGVIIPSNIEGEVNIALMKKMTEKIMISLTEKFGGATVREQVGTWKGEDGKIVFEKNMYVYCNIDDVDLPEASYTLKGIGEVIKSEMNQESVYLKVNEKAIFV